MSGLLKRGLDRISGGVNTWESRIHQSKSWLYLGYSQTSKVEIVFRYKLLTRFCKKLQLECLTGCIRHLQKTLFMFC